MRGEKLRAKGKTHDLKPSPLSVKPNRTVLSYGHVWLPKEMGLWCLLTMRLLMGASG